MDKFNKGDLVWAKIKGYPWWPGMVARTNVNKNGVVLKEVMINFVGENSHAKVAIDKLVNFMDNIKTYQNPKNKKLTEAVKIAMKIQEGITTFEGTISKIRSIYPLIEEHSKYKFSDGFGTDEEEEETEVPKPKKGRPGRKKAEESDKVEVKPKRGRPRASASKEPKSEEESIKEEEDIKVEETPKPKGRRGRKPKNAQPTPTPPTRGKQSAPKSEDEMNSEEEEAPPKKSPGRKLPVAKVSSKRRVSERSETPARSTRVAAKHDLNSTEETTIRKKKTANHEEHSETSEVPRFEKELNDVLAHIVKKTQKKDKFKERDSDLNALGNLIEEFENHKFSPSEYLASDFGKIFRTINHVVSKNKDLLPKSQEGLTTTLTKVIHKIKYRVLKNFLDNSDYLEKYGIEKEIEPKDKNKHGDYSDNSESPKKSETKHESKMFSANGKTSAANDESPTKKDENEQSLVLRKKVCQKFAKILQSNYDMEKEPSQELTLKVEGNIHNISQGSQDEYRKHIKTLHNLLKHQLITVEELTGVQDMDAKKFHDFTTIKGKSIEEGKKSDKKSSKKKDDDDGDDSN